MHLRHYNGQKDYLHITKWIQDERTHALWCANLLSYPLSEDEFHNYLIEQNLKLSFQFRSETRQNEKGYDGAYVYADENNRPVGFFIYTVNEQDKSGFLRFIMVDNSLRGKGYGSDMIKELLQLAYEKTGVSSVRLLVFDVNAAAKRCYEKIGFTFTENMPESFPYQDEVWKRRMMEHRADFERNF